MNQNSYDHTDWDAVKSDPNSLKAKYGRWIRSHDAEAYAYSNYDKVLDHLINDTPFENTDVPRGYVYRPWTIDDLQVQRNKGKIELQGDWS